MTAGLSVSLQDIKDFRKTAVINDELKRLSVDIATLQETRFCRLWYHEGEGLHILLAREALYDEPSDYGVGYAVRNSSLRTAEPGSGGSERLLTLRLNSTTGPFTLISVYAPTLSATPDTKDIFYENLTSIIRNISSREQSVVLGDSMPGWVQIMTCGPPALVSWEWAK